MNQHSHLFTNPNMLRPIAAACLRTAAVHRTATAAAAPALFSGAVRAIRAPHCVRLFSSAVSGSDLPADDDDVALVPPTAAGSSKLGAGWADELAPLRQMQLLRERGLQTPRGKKGGKKQKDEVSGSTNSAAAARDKPWPRGVPKPKPKLPTPAALAPIDRPWMQSQLSLQFDVPAGSAAPHAQPFRLNIAQWTGMEEIGWQPPRRRKPRKPAANHSGTAGVPADAIDAASPLNVHPPIDVQTSDAPELDAPVDEEAEAEAAWVEAPVLTEAERAAEEEKRAQADAGSGSIVWDAAVHLAHYLHRAPAPPSGPVLELGAGTGVLGLAVASMLRAGAAAAAAVSSIPDQRAILTENGKVLELLQQNVAANATSAAGAAGVAAVPLEWSDAGLTAFLSNKNLPPFYSTILCSELLDAIPSSANAQRGVDPQALSDLVRALTRIAQHSAAAKRAQGVSGGVDVLFTFEQRGVLSLGDGGVLDEALLAPLRQAGFEIERLQNQAPFTHESSLCLFRFHME